MNPMEILPPDMFQELDQPPCVRFEGHHYNRTSCSNCWPYWGDRLERFAPRRQCEELHAHQPHDWQTSRMADPTMVCPGRATCDASVTAINLRELPPPSGAVSADALAQVQRMAEQLSVPLAELPEAGGHYSQWQERVWKAGWLCGGSGRLFERPCSGCPDCRPKEPGR